MVFAVLGSGVFLSPCLAKYGIPSIQGGQFQDAKTINRELILTAAACCPCPGAGHDRPAGCVDVLHGVGHAHGAPWRAPAKVGLIYQDIPVFRNYYVEIKKQLKKHGLTVDSGDEFIYSPTVDGATSQSQAAVLKVHADGVTHVVGAALFFFQAAENQNYRPRYGMDSLVPPASLAANVGASQLQGALAIGWRPTQDVNQSEDPGHVSPLATKCTNMMQAAGEDTAPHRRLPD